MIPILIEGEFRSLIRNSLERFIGVNMKNKEKMLKRKEYKIALKLATRVISSLIAIFIFNFIKNNGFENKLREYVTYVMVAIFFYILTLQN